MGIEALDPCKVMVNGDISISEVGKNKQIFRDLIKTENWQKVKEDFWPIVRKDLRMVDHSDFVIFSARTAQAIKKRARFVSGPATDTIV
jgi:hypothetical protein